MEKTISMMMGKGSLNHNNRAFTAKNVDKERSQYNQVFVKEDIRKVYHALFDKALDSYNAKQTRSDRKIDNYYEKIRTSKQEKLFHEVIVQIGNKDDTNCTNIESLNAMLALGDYMEEFQKRNPNLRVFNAVLHLDEETPHLHIDFVPFSTANKRGLETKVSLKGALKAQGFVGTGRHDTEWKRWVESEKKCLAEIMKERDMEWKQKGTHEKHLSVYDYEKKMRKAEVEELEQVITDKEDRIASQTEAMKVNEEMLVFQEQSIRRNKEKTEEMRMEAEKKVQALEERKEKVIVELEKMQEEFAELQRNKEMLREKMKATEIKLEIANAELAEVICEFEKVKEQTQSTVEEAKKSYDKYSSVAVTERQYEMFEDMVQLKQENAQLKAENQTLREKLQKAYEFMRQFTIGGMNMLEKFLASVGERAQNLVESFRSR